MSHQEQRLAAPRAALPEEDICSLEQKLKNIGITPLNKARVARCMYAASYGLNPMAWQWRVKWCAGNWQPEKWHVFDYETYMNASVMRTSNGSPTYGYPMPSILEQRAEHVLRSLPGVRVRVHAIYKDDPWVGVFDPETSESAWIGGWYGRGVTQRVFLSLT